MEPTLTIRDDPSTTSSSATATCTTAVPGKHGEVPFDACNSNYLYDPSFEANCAFAVLFGLTFIAHITQAFAWKKVNAHHTLGHAWLLTSDRDSAGSSSWAPRGRPSPS